MLDIREPLIASLREAINQLDKNMNLNNIEIDDEEEEEVSVENLNNFVDLDASKNILQKLIDSKIFPVLREYKKEHIEAQKKAAGGGYENVMFYYTLSNRFFPQLHASFNANMGDSLNYFKKLNKAIEYTENLFTLNSQGLKALNNLSKKPYYQGMNGNIFIHVTSILKDIISNEKNDRTETLKFIFKTKLEEQNNSCAAGFKGRLFQVYMSLFNHYLQNFCDKNKINLQEILNLGD